MKKQIPPFLAGVLTALLVLSLGASALAASCRLTLEVDPVRIQVDGQLFQPKDVNGNDVPVFSYNGTTYAPLRALAEAYGLTVGYDAETNLATVTTARGPAADAIPAADTPRKNTVQAATAAELVAAIAPDTEIILAPGDYDLTELAGKTDNPYVVWYEEFDGPQLNVVNVSGLTIRGQDRDQVELLATPRYADVFHFQGCSDLVLDGLTIGHTPTGSCLGSVLNFTDCGGVRVTGCGLFGCGTYGVESEGVTGLLVEKSAIYHCSYGAATILNSQTVTFDGCEVYDNMAWSLFGLTSSSGVTLSDTVVRNNGSNADGGSYLLSLSNCDAVAVRGCRFEDNALANFSDTSAGNLALAVENCTFEGNSFAAPNG